MSLNAKRGAEFIQIEPGNYIGICYRLIDIGTQHGIYKDPKSGKEVPTERKQVLIAWEFPTELITEGEYEGQPYSISKFYTISLDKKANLCKDLESWRGKAFTEEELQGFDLKKILGKPCMINVIRDEKDRSVAKAITPMPKGFVAPKGINPQVAFDIDEWNNDVFQSLPEGIQKLITQSDEFKASMKQDGTNQHYDERNPPPPDDDVPF